MTRGTVIIRNGKKFLAIRYSNADSYPSGEIGDMFVRALSAPSDEETARIIQTYVFSCDSEDTRNCWESLMYQGEGFYDKKKARTEDYFYDYAYVYDVKSCALKIYYFGDLAYTFRKSDVEYLKLLAGHESMLYYALGYDSRKNQISGQGAKVFRKLMREKKSPEEILAMAQKIYADIHYLIDASEIADCCWEDGYKKEVTFFPSKKCLSFIVSQGTFEHHWRLRVQLPWGRFTIGFYNSKKAALKGLAEHLGKHWKSLLNGLPLYPLYEEYRKKLYDYCKGFDPGTSTEADYLAFASGIEKEFQEKLSAYESVDFSGYNGGLSAKKAAKKLSSGIHNGYMRIFRYAVES